MPFRPGASRSRREKLSLHTRLVTEYGATYPIANAGMAFVGLTDLAIAVSNAGGMGVYGAAPAASRRRPTKEVAFELGISPNTVGTILTSAKNKLGVRSRVELVEMARRLGLNQGPTGARARAASSARE